MICSQECIRWRAALEDRVEALEQAAERRDKADARRDEVLDRLCTAVAALAGKYDAQAESFVRIEKVLGRILDLVTPSAPAPETTRIYGERP